ncbi:uL15m family ribosomal protein [Candidatus Nitrosarchaeum limnium]|jgi:large subunit ribosomal protein L15|uniref:Large ribosomal subunit protein uL15 n=2 Tax=Candidatus Nitrosarchaeum limnium TaxID=1007084 RepID=S2E6Q8_9ARCH|nr:uL15m family ribosomal protein [Candidatus Nitrosarchaeum limnium]EGG41408.1 ribosomal protein L15 [Candidatus Nitrosarchaeum limnium SFB1]EPA05126.1 ribosomal protein L15 [Candidatus Nitrosarchaeum limnium BG20]
MATRLRKTRRLRGGRHMGWGQVGQHRASGHKGGLGIAGLHKYHFSTLLKEMPDHFGHDSTHPPHPIITRKWASVRDLDDLFAKLGKEEGGKKVIDLITAGYDKLLGGGKVSKPYTVKVPRFTATAEEKIKSAGGEVLATNG